jgi:hypothetical protein
MITSFQWISANRVVLGLRGIEGEEGRITWNGRGDGRIEIWEIDESMTCAKIVKRLELENVSFVYPLTCHCTFSITFFYNLIKDYITNVAWDERTKCLAACSHGGQMTVNCRWLLEWACHVELVVFRRFGRWTETNPFTSQRSMDVRVWLGVQTGNKRTAREWKRPGNRPKISFWLLGELTNGRINVFKKWD